MGFRRVTIRLPERIIEWLDRESYRRTRRKGGRLLGSGRNGLVLQYVIEGIARDKLKHAAMRGADRGGADQKEEKWLEEIRQAIEDGQSPPLID